MAHPLNFYNRNHKYQQRQIAWKSSETIEQAIAPTMTRPLNNGAAEGLDEDNYIFPRRRPGPLKQWRLSHGGQQHNGIPKISQIERPGGTIVITDKHINIDNQIQHLGELCKNCRGIFLVIDNLHNRTSGHVQCCAGKSEPFVVKSGQTLLKSNCSAISNRQYLLKRCKTFAQNEFNFDTRCKDNREGQYKKMCSSCGCCLDATNDLNSPYYNCCDSNKHSKNCKLTDCNTAYYKPNNAQFRIQGAVSSSSRLGRLKNNTLTACGGVYGCAATSRFNYLTNYQNENVIKAMTQKCVPHHRTGDKAVCFQINDRGGGDHQKRLIHSGSTREEYREDKEGPSASLNALARVRHRRTAWDHDTGIQEHEGVTDRKRRHKKHSRKFIEIVELRGEDCMKAVARVLHKRIMCSAKMVDEIGGGGDKKFRHKYKNRHGRQAIKLYEHIAPRAAYQRVRHTRKLCPDCPPSQISPRRRCPSDMEFYQLTSLTPYAIKAEWYSVYNSDGRYQLRIRIHGTNQWTLLPIQYYPESVGRIILLEEIIVHLKSGTKYDVELRTFNKWCPSDWSDSKSIRTQYLPPGQMPPPHLASNSPWSITASWSTVEDSGGYYELRFKETSSEEWKHTDIVYFEYPGEGTYDINGLTPDTEYEVQIRTENHDLWNIWSESNTQTTLSLTPSPSPPDKMDPPTLTVINKSTIDVTWDTVRDSDGRYQIEYKATGLIGFIITDFITVESGLKEGYYRIQSLLPSTTYDVEIRALNIDSALANQFGPWSNPAQATTPGSVGPIIPPTPDSPTLQIVGYDDDKQVIIRVTWHTFDDANYTYSLQYATTQSGPWTEINDIEADPDSDVYYDIPEDAETLEYHTTYYVEIKAVHGWSGDWSVPASITTCYRPPHANEFPTNISVKPSETKDPATSLDVSWVASTLSGVIYYELQYKKSTDSDYIPVDNISATSYTITGLEENTTYDVEVATCATCGTIEDTEKCSDMSPPVQGTTCHENPPDVPTGLSAADAGPHAIEATWNTVAGMLYNIQFKKDTDANYTEVSGYVTSPCTIGGLDPNTLYDVEVKACWECSTGGVSPVICSDWSAPASATTSVNPGVLPVKMDPPTLYIVGGCCPQTTPSSTDNCCDPGCDTTDSPVYQINVSWPVAGDSNGHYTIQYDNGGGSVVIADINMEGITDPSYNIPEPTASALVFNTEYEVEIAAKNTVGTGPFSDPASIDIPPDKMPDLIVGAVTGSTITVTWTDVGNPPIVSYDLRYKKDGKPDWPSPVSVSGVSSYTFIDLEPNTEYNLEIRAINTASKCGPYSNAVTHPTIPDVTGLHLVVGTSPDMTPPCTIGDCCSPDSCTDCEYTCGTSSAPIKYNIKASWKSLTDGTITYKVQWKISGGTAFNSADPIDDTFYIITAYDDGAPPATPLVYNETYEVQVAASNDGGTTYGNWSPPEPISLPPGDMCNSEFKVSTSSPPTPTKITVTWTDVGNPSIDSYDLRYKKDGKPDWSSPTSVLAGVQSYTFTDLDPNTVYDLEIRAKNNATSNNCGPYIQTSGTTDFNIPPVMFFETLTSTLPASFTCNWEKPTVPEGIALMKYEIRYKLITDSDWSTPQPIKSNLTTDTIHNLKPNNAYNVQIRAVYGINSTPSTAWKQGPWPTNKSNDTPPGPGCSCNSDSCVYKSCTDASGGNGKPCCITTKNAPKIDDLTLLVAPLDKKEQVVTYNLWTIYAYWTPHENSDGTYKISYNTVDSAITSKDYRVKGIIKTYHDINSASNPVGIRIGPAGKWEKDGGKTPPEGPLIPPSSTNVADLKKDGWTVKSASSSPPNTPDNSKWYNILQDAGGHNKGSRANAPGLFSGNNYSIRGRVRYYDNPEAYGPFSPELKICTYNGLPLRMLLVTMKNASADQFTIQYNVSWDNNSVQDNTKRYYNVVVASDDKFKTIKFQNQSSTSLSPADPQTDIILTPDFNITDGTKYYISIQAMCNPNLSLTEDKECEECAGWTVMDGVYPGVKDCDGGIGPNPCFAEYSAPLEYQFS